MSLSPNRCPNGRKPHHHPSSEALRERAHGAMFGWSSGAADILTKKFASKLDVDNLDDFFRQVAGDDQRMDISECVGAVLPCKHPSHIRRRIGLRVRL